MLLHPSCGKKVPELRVRVVNVTDLMILGSGHPHSLTKEDFHSLFTSDKTVVVNYHGYAQDLRGLLFGRPDLVNSRFGESKMKSKQLADIQIGASHSWGL